MSFSLSRLREAANVYAGQLVGVARGPGGGVVTPEAVLALVDVAEAAKAFTEGDDLLDLTVLAETLEAFDA